MNPVYCVLDYETRSEADLKAVGAYEYAMHPSTRILCAAWRIGTRDELLTAPIETWSPFFRKYEPQSLFEALTDLNRSVIAHNAFFEQVITKFVLKRDVPVDRWICTASRARALALPGKLEMACKALGLPVEKDMEGHRLMLKMSKPRKPTKNNPAKWHNKVSDLKRLIEYCKRDVEAETHLFLNIDELSPNERKVWCLNQKIAWRGFHVDRELVTKVLKLIDEEIPALDRETAELTNGDVRSATQRAKLLDAINVRGDLNPLPDLTAKTVSDALLAPLLDPVARRLLEIRQAVSKSSTAKYGAFAARSATDSRARDNLVYHTASTGRDGGAGIQPQNFPRGVIKYDEDTIDHVKSFGLPLIKALHGDAMSLFSSMLRGCIVAPPGKELFCGDYASIEVRVLFWVADHWDGLQAIRESRDLYKEIATKIYRVKLNTVTKPQREVGKRAVLGCGYGMGHKRFGETCEQFGQPVSEELAETAVKAYREVHEPVTWLWSNLEKAAIAAVLHPGKSYSINHTKWFMRGKYLFCELPSGRKLSYYGAHVKFEEKWGRKRPELRYYGVNAMTRQWCVESTWGGKLTENVVQAIARDVLKYAEPKLEAKGYEIVLVVHDEVLAERKVGEGTVEEFKYLMGLNPPWAADLPVSVEAGKGHRYSK